MRIIGIHDGHNAAACLLERRGDHGGNPGRATDPASKTATSLPARAVQWLLEQAGCDWSGIDAVALNGFHQPVHRDRQLLIEATRFGGGLPDPIGCCGAAPAPRRSSRFGARAAAAVFLQVDLEVAFGLADQHRLAGRSRRTAGSGPCLRLAGHMMGKIARFLAYQPLAGDRNLAKRDLGPRAEALGPLLLPIVGRMDRRMGQHGAQWFRRVEPDPGVLHDGFW